LNYLHSDISDEIIDKLNNISEQKHEPLASSKWVHLRKSIENNMVLRDELNNIIHKQDNEKLKIKLLEQIETLDPQDIVMFQNKIDNIPNQDYKWYFDLRDYGFSMTCGFGSGSRKTSVLVIWW